MCVKKYTREMIIAMLFLSSLRLASIITSMVLMIVIIIIMTIVSIGIFMDCE